MTFKATLTSKGQLTLPKALRDHFKLREGDHLLIDFNDDHIELRVLAQSSIDQLFDRLPRTQEPVLDDAQLAQRYGQHRLERQVRSGPSAIQARERPKPEAHQARQVPLWMQEGAGVGSREVPTLDQEAIQAREVPTLDQEGAVQIKKRSGPSGAVQIKKRSGPSGAVQIKKRSK